MKVYVVVTWDRFEEEVKNIQVFHHEQPADAAANAPEKNIWISKDVWEEEVI
jgi:hypothetical protein